MGRAKIPNLQYFYTRQTLDSCYLYLSLPFILLILYHLLKLRSSFRKSSSVPILLSLPSGLWILLNLVDCVPCYYICETGDPKICYFLIQRSLTSIYIAWSLYMEDMHLLNM